MTRVFQAYVELTRPRLTFLVVITTMIGWHMAFRGSPHFLFSLFAVVCSTALLAGGASALNQHAEKETDAKMRRTLRRPLPSGRLEAGQACKFGLLLSAAGLSGLYFYVNPLATGLGFLAWGSYLFVYTPLKRKTSFALLIGTIPGAMPPMIGWAAATGTLALGAWFLFGLMVLWQIPHFLAIGRIYEEDYNRAGLRLLSQGPGKDRAIATQMVGSLVLLLGFSICGFIWKLSGFYYLQCALVFGSAFLTVGLVLAREKTIFAARQLFLISLLYLPLTLAALTLDKKI